MRNRPQLKWVPLRFLIIDYRYQREIRDDFLRKIIREFQPEKLTALSVSKRSDTEYAVFSGQHRFLALSEIGWKSAPCVVHENLTAAEESELFDSEGKDRRNLTLHDIWKSELFRAEEPTATINRIVEGEGFRVTASHVENGIGAIMALRRTYRRNGEEGLRQVLRLIAPWEGMLRGRDGNLIEGIAILLRTTGEGLDLDRLGGILKKSDPATIAARSASRQRNMGGAGQRGIFVREELLHMYNKGLRSRRLLLVDYDDESGESGEEAA
jgi:uncharacterized protein DUF6551